MKKAMLSGAGSEDLATITAKEAQNRIHVALSIAGSRSTSCRR